MKRFLSLVVALIAMFTMTVSAQQKVGEYTNSYFSKTFSIEAGEENDKITSVYIGVHTDLDFRKA